MNYQAEKDMEEPMQFKPIQFKPVLFKGQLYMIPTL